MLRDDLIALGLHSPNKPSTSPDGEIRPFTPVERLLTILRDVIAVVELPDAGSLHTCIEDMPENGLRGKGCPDDPGCD